MTNPNQITSSFPPPILIPAPGTQGGPCDASARDKRVLEIAYSYGKALLEGTPSPSRLHAQLVTVTNAPECDHPECRVMRWRASQTCGLCLKPVGYDEPAFVCGAVPHKPNGASYVHEACFNRREERAMA